MTYSEEFKKSFAKRCKELAIHYYNMSEQEAMRESCIAYLSTLHEETDILNTLSSIKDFTNMPIQIFILYESYLTTSYTGEIIKPEDKLKEIGNVYGIRSDKYKLLKVFMEANNGCLH